MKGKLVLTTVLIIICQLQWAAHITNFPTISYAHSCPYSNISADSHHKPTTKATVPPTKVVETSTVTPDIAGTVVAISQSKVFASYPSPNGQWRAEIIIAVLADPQRQCAATGLDLNRTQCHTPLPGRRLDHRGGS
jgi:hypothetical protein